MDNSQLPPSQAPPTPPTPPQIPPIPPQEPPTPPHLPGSNNQSKKNTRIMVVSVVVAVVLLPIIVLTVIGLLGYQDLQNKAEQEQAQSTKETDSKSSKADSKSREAELASRCLTPKDVGAVFSHYDPMDYVDSFDEGNYIVGESLFFLPDSSNYEFGQLTIDDLDQLAKLYNDNSKKQFIYEISGSTRESAQSSAGLALAAERAGKVKQDLVTRGVPADRIVILEPRYSADSEASRNVGVSIEKSGDCAVSQ